MLFSLPPFPTIKLTEKNILIYGGLFIVGLLVYKKFFATQKPIVPALPTPNLTHADKIVLNINPADIVLTNSTMLLEGAFLDSAGNTITVPKGYYYIFRDTGLSTGYQYVYGGSLGDNVSTFRTNVPTTFFQEGSYEVVVSDEPIPDSTLGAGAFANPPYQGDTTFKDSSNVIKNAIQGFAPAPMFPSTNRVFPGDMPPQMLANDLASLQ